MRSYDVVVVGGGIGGTGCATVLARAGLDVCVLEPTTTYPDVVRGEWLSPWGVKDAKATGLYDVLVEAGGHTVAKHVSFDETADADAAVANALQLSSFVPDVGGPLCIRHPEACDAYASAALAAGATMHRGASKIEVGGTVARYELDGAAHEVGGRIVIGADGRASPLRRSLGFDLVKEETDHYLGGLLVDGLDWLPDDTEFIATEGGLHTLLFPQGGGRARLYVAFPVAAHEGFTGRDRAATYLRTCAMSCWPGSDAFARAEAAGPAHAYRSAHTLVERPYTEGVVLVGDAAGYSDPIIGLGLSVTARDTRLVTTALLANEMWEPEIFEAYAAERAERMRRLVACAKAYAVGIAGFGPGLDPELRHRFRTDPTVMMQLGAAMVGPEVIPPFAYEDDVFARLVPA